MKTMLILPIITPETTGKIFLYDRFFIYYIHSSHCMSQILHTRASTQEKIQTLANLRIFHTKVPRQGTKPHATYCNNRSETCGVSEGESDIQSALQTRENNLYYASHRCICLPHMMATDHANADPSAPHFLSVFDLLSGHKVLRR